MKESDAVRKICPHLKEHHKVNDGFYCYGSGCMMWEQWPLVENNQYVKDADGKVLMGDSGDCGLKTKEFPQP